MGRGRQAGPGSDRREEQCCEYEHLGADGVARLTELGRGFLFAAASAGAFPEDLVGKG
nr:hypothetical protein [Streptomyces sp. FT05W]